MLVKEGDLVDEEQEIEIETENVVLIGGGEKEKRILCPSQKHINVDFIDFSC